MFSFCNPNIKFAVTADIPALKDLLNNAYRGEASKQGWTTEADLITGDIRTDENILQQVLEQSGSVFLVYRDDEQNIIGCVNLQEHAERLYLGMFSVSPQLQGGGIGKKLLQAAEEYARHLDKKAIYMSVINQRTELVNWYMRHGYEDTKERKPFTEDGITGKHLQPLEFMMLEKPV
ncbi:MAG: GNAT family N-acetyltransferase [Ferruginibacter sp.]|nr:GNAT family N-acetyltransferase [Ferruginibacter sp.]